MTNDYQFNIQAAFHTANETVRIQEEDAKLQLLEQIANKAESNPRFLRSLQENPEQIVKREAQAFSDQLTSDQIEDVIENTREKFPSALVPGVEEEDVRKLILDTVKSIRRSFSLSMLLNVVLFCFGIGTILTAFIVAISGGEKHISLLFGAGGLVSILISSFVMSPLNRIQNAAGTLVQLQMAHISFYKQLSLLGANTKPLSHEQAVSCSHEISKLCESSLSAIQTYIGKGARGQPPATQQSSNEPAQPTSSSAKATETQTGTPRGTRSASLGKEATTGTHLRRDTL